MNDRWACFGCGRLFGLAVDGSYEIKVHNRQYVRILALVIEGVCKCGLVTTISGMSVSFRRLERVDNLHLNKSPDVP